MTFNCRFYFFSLPAKCHLAVMPEAEKNWVGHHSQIFISLLCQQLLSTNICHLDCFCYTAVKIRRACVHDMIISRSMLGWLIWRQMTLLIERARVMLMWPRHNTAAAPTKTAPSQEISDSQKTDSSLLCAWTVNWTAISECCKLEFSISWTWISTTSSSQLPSIA